MDNDKGMSADNLAEYEMMCERICNSTNINVYLTLIIRKNLNQRVLFSLFLVIKITYPKFKIL